MSNNREDYPDLTDAQYANFRSIATSGPRKTSLCRIPHFGKPCKTRFLYEAMLAKTGFFEVATSGMGARVLYRSSSPVNPKYNRNREADAAVNSAGIFTVINLADNEGEMKGYEDFAQTYYSGLDVIPLDLVVDFSADSFREGLAKGFRFMISHDAPYLIHCTMGKDRAGFTSAVLECLMGASAEEVVADEIAALRAKLGTDLN
ncbi:MAG: tyrosine-protein phosphatase [Clostridia bacterium]|nr:tyrosine-protein phosphatase [Clostridia bacterium]